MPPADAHHHGSVGPAETAIGVIIGRTSEFFDFFVYAIASVLVFPKLVFPYADPLTGTLYSFAIFALAFVARPRSEEHTSELQSLMRISYSVFCFKKKTTT